MGYDQGNVSLQYFSTSCYSKLHCAQICGNSRANLASRSDEATKVATDTASMMEAFR